MNGIEEAVALIAATYKDDFAQDRIGAYLALLKDLDPGRVWDATVTLCREERFAPLPAEIRKVVVETALREQGIPTEQEAWEMVIDPTLHGQLPPLVLEALRGMGGRGRIAAMEENGQQGSARREFIAAYEYRRERESRIVAVNEPGPTMKALPVSDKILPRPGGIHPRG